MILLKIKDLKKYIPIIADMTAMRSNSPREFMGSDPINFSFKFCLEKFNGIRPHHEILKMRVSCDCIL